MFGPMFRFEDAWVLALLAIVPIAVTSDRSSSA